MFLVAGEVVDLDVDVDSCPYVQLLCRIRKVTPEFEMSLTATASFVPFLLRMLLCINPLILICYLSLDFIASFWVTSQRSNKSSKQLLLLFTRAVLDMLQRMTKKVNSGGNAPVNGTCSNCITFCTLGIK
jgi:hypothetical protein